MSISVTAAAVLASAIKASATMTSGLLNRRDANETQRMREDLMGKQRELEQEQYDFSMQQGRRKRGERDVYDRINMQQTVDDMAQSRKQQRTDIMQHGADRLMGERVGQINLATEQAKRRGGQLG